METVCDVIVHFGERLQRQEDVMKTSNVRIIDALQLIAANTRCDDSTHSFRRADRCSTRQRQRLSTNDVG